MNHYVYIIESLVDGSYYKGYSNDYERRLVEHNAGLSEYTSKKVPWHLIYVELCADKSIALKRERKLKRANKDYLRWLLIQDSNILIRN